MAENILKSKYIVVWQPEQHHPPPPTHPVVGYVRSMCNAIVNECFWSINMYLARPDPFEQAFSGSLYCDQTPL